MPTLSELVSAQGRSSADDIEWLHRLAGDGQLLADLAFADIVFWVPTKDDSFIAVAQSSAMFIWATTVASVSFGSDGSSPPPPICPRRCPAPGSAAPGGGAGGRAGAWAFGARTAGSVRG